MSSGMRSTAAKNASVWAPEQAPSVIGAHRSGRARPRSAGRVSGHSTAAATSSRSDTTPAGPTASSIGSDSAIPSRMIPMAPTARATPVG
jgi:hypothetical protein